MLRSMDFLFFLFLFFLISLEGFAGDVCVVSEPTNPNYHGPLKILRCSDQSLPLLEASSVMKGVGLRRVFLVHGNGTESLERFLLSRGYHSKKCSKSSCLLEWEKN